MREAEAGGVSICTLTVFWAEAWHVCPALHLSDTVDGRFKFIWRRYLTCLCAQ